MRLNYEIFYVTPRSAEEMRCRVCGAKCNVRRDVYGPENFVHAIGKINDLWDVFTCPHAGKGWHEQALRLSMAIEETPSKRVAALMQQDLEDILKESGEV